MGHASDTDSESMRQVQLSSTRAAAAIFSYPSSCSSSERLSKSQNLTTAVNATVFGVRSQRLSAGAGIIRLERNARTFWRPFFFCRSGHSLRPLEAVDPLWRPQTIRSILLLSDGYYFSRLCSLRRNLYVFRINHQC